MQAMEVLKQYHRDGQQLTLKHFADDDSEGWFDHAVWLVLFSNTYYWYFYSIYLAALIICEQQ